MTIKPLTSILIKPAGPDCNIYWFYLEKAAYFTGTRIHYMMDEVLEETVY